VAWWLGGWYMAVGGFRLPVLPTHYYKEYNIIIMSGIKCQRETGKHRERVLRKEEESPNPVGADGAYTHTATSKTCVYVCKIRLFYKQFRVL